MEEKKYPIGGFAPGKYQCKCGTCGKTFNGDKRAVQCEPCALEAKARFDALDPNDKELLIKRNARIANYMFSGPLSVERDLIYRIVEEWGNAIEMPNMEQWLKDYAATRQPCAMWVKASEFKTNEPVFRPFRRKREDGVPEYDYGEIYVTEDNGEIFLDINNERSYEPQHFERWKDYEILDESGTPVSAREEDAVTIFEELWDEHSEYIDDDIDSLSRWAGSSVVDKEQFKTIVAKMWELFKQQKENP